ncbi:MAG: alpha/beta hydrolase [Prevotella sp.]|nr:alpha/beta hydrolase [Prevotella sp.]
MKTKLILFLMGLFVLNTSHQAAFAQDKRTVLEDGGTGPYKAVMYEVEGFKEHTLFAPADLSPFSAAKPLPVLVWGNGGCANSPRGHEKFLNDIASYGYLVLATGIMPSQDAPRRMGGGMGMGGQSRSEQQVESMDWAFAQNADKNSPYYQKIDTKNICISGMSCGGLQALFNCFDERVTSIMICNSGLFDTDGGAPRMGGMPSVPKDKLKDIHCPIIYILGGETDIAYANGMDDFKRIEHVPAIAVNLPVGHGGTYNQPNGGEFAIVARAWLDWQLKGNADASKMFVGESPAILQRPDWTLQKNAKVE